MPTIARRIVLAILIIVLAAIVIPVARLTWQAFEQGDRRTFWLSVAAIGWLVVYAICRSDLYDRILERCRRPS